MLLRMNPYGGLERQTYETGLKEYQHIEDETEGPEAGEKEKDEANLRIFYQNALVFLDTVSVYEYLLFHRR